LEKSPGGTFGRRTRKRRHKMKVSAKTIPGKEAKDPQVIEPSSFRALFVFSANPCSVMLPRIRHRNSVMRQKHDDLGVLKTPAPPLRHSSGQASTLPRAGFDIAPGWLRPFDRLTAQGERQFKPLCGTLMRLSPSVNDYKCESGTFLPSRLLRRQWRANLPVFPSFPERWKRVTWHGKEEFVERH
jgi:hypothetical protein